MTDATELELNDMEADARREYDSQVAMGGYIPHCVGYTIALVAEVRRLRVGLAEALPFVLPDAATTRMALNGDSEACERIYEIRSTRDRLAELLSEEKP